MSGSVVRVAASLAASATLLAAGAATAGQSAGQSGSARASVQHGVLRLPTIDDAGRKTTFPLHWAAPSRGARALVVVFHGHTHNGDEWQAELNSMAARDHVVAVAPRTTETSAKNGKGLFDTVDEEARDAAAAIAFARYALPKMPTYLLCVSMGCTGLAYFIDAAVGPHPETADARWVRQHKPLPIAGVVVSEGLSNLVETWSEAAAADPTSQHEIEHEARTSSGDATPKDNFAAYQSRSLALLSAKELAAFGVKSAAVIHDVDDGLVPVNQAVESRAALRAASIATHGYTVVGNHPGCSSTNQTTGTSYVGSYVQQYTGRSEVKNHLDPTLCLAGHATETHPETAVMRVTFDVLHQMITSGVGAGETTVDVAAG